MSERLSELALTAEEVEEILHSVSDRAVLVGGQALAFWAQYYGVTPLGPLAVNITRDADFLGSAQVAHDLAKALKTKGWRYWRASLDDGTAQTAKLSKRIEGEGVKQIDFLGNVIGLDARHILRRAVTVCLNEGVRLKVLHPLDVLVSRLKNLAVLPSKRNRQGIAQAQLALQITRCHFEDLAREGDARPLLDAIEYVARVAQDKSLTSVFHDFNLNLLSAVPVDDVPSEEFRARRWPQIRAMVEKREQSYALRRAKLKRKKR